MTVEQRRNYLAWMQQSLPAVPEWNAWQQKTGELPPDFDALRSANYLPEPFQFVDGRPVTMPAQWPQRRAEIGHLFEKYVVGR